MTRALQETTVRRPSTNRARSSYSLRTVDDEQVELAFVVVASSWVGCGACRDIGCRFEGGRFPDAVRERVRKGTSVPIIYLFARVGDWEVEKPNTLQPVVRDMHFVCPHAHCEEAGFGPRHGRRVEVSNGFNKAGRMPTPRRKGGQQRKGGSEMYQRPGCML